MYIDSISEIPKIDRERGLRTQREVVNVDDIDIAKVMVATT